MIINSDDIYRAWAILRKVDSTIPDETLDFMKDVSLRELELTNKMDDDAYTFNEMVNIPGRYYCHLLGQGVAVEVEENKISMLSYSSPDSDDNPIRYNLNFRKEMLNMNFYKMKRVKDLFNW